MPRQQLRLELVRDLPVVHALPLSAALLGIQDHVQHVAAAACEHFAARHAHAALP